MNAFTVERNIEKYADRLRTELDTAERTSLKTLLIEEERRFGYYAEQLGSADSYIADCDARIKKQQILVEMLRSGTSNYDLSFALHFLSNLNELRGLFQQFRRNILCALSKYPRHCDAIVRARARTLEENSLTAREKEVLTLLAHGNSTEQAADTLGIAKRTLDFHVQAVLGKLDVANRTQAVAVAIDAGIIKFN